MTERRFNQKGVISFALLYLLVLVIFLILFAFIVPFSINFNTQLMSGADTMLEQANADVNSITDANIRSELQTSIDNATDTVTDNTDNLSTYFQFAWILVPVIVALIMFIVTRTSVERGLV